MEDEIFEKSRKAVLEHIEELFEDMEKELAMSHQEKYALLEDMLSSATDHNELRVAFDQWYNDHSEDIDFDHELDELWDQAMSRVDEE